MCCEIMSCSDSSGGVTRDVSLEEPSPSANAGLGGVGVGGRSSGIGQGAGLVLTGRGGGGGEEYRRSIGLRLALLDFDCLGFDGSGACWFGLARRGQGLREFAGHGPWRRLALDHGLAHVAHALRLRSTRAN